MSFNQYTISSTTINNILISYLYTVSVKITLNFSFIFRYNCFCSLLSAFHSTLNISITRNLVSLRAVFVHNVKELILCGIITLRSPIPYFIFCVRVVIDFILSVIFRRIIPTRYLSTHNSVLCRLPSLLRE